MHTVFGSLDLGNDRGDGWHCSDGSLLGGGAAESLKYSHQFLDYPRIVWRPRLLFFLFLLPLCWRPPVV